MYIFINQLYVIYINTGLNFQHFILESFTCPGGFFKCPGSFCLENRFVCDGEKQCSAGEDERNCGLYIIEYSLFVYA